jgi:ABC-type Fe3+/spermidine/putrescine transport system ATPase subunit
MLDEPLGSVDRTLRERLLADLRQILRKMQQTAIYVTHDQEEAFAIADRVVLMQQGSIEQIGTPQAIYHEPNSAFVARFLGMTNLLPGTIAVDGANNRLRMPIGEIAWSGTQPGEVTVLIRPDAATLELNGDLVMTGVVVEKTFRGNLCQLRVMLNGNLLTFDFLSSTQLPAPGEPIQLSIQTREALRVFLGGNS